MGRGKRGRWWNTRLVVPAPAPGGDDERSVFSPNKVLALLLPLHHFLKEKRTMPFGLGAGLVGPVLLAPTAADTVGNEYLQVQSGEFHH